MMFEAYRRYADFEGRSSRAEYWLFALFLWLTVLAAELVASLAGAIGGKILEAVVMLPAALFLLASLVPGIAVAIRRLHDTGRSGWWLLISFIPFIGGLVLLVFYCLPGTPGSNRFGPPAGRSAQDLQETFA